MSKVSIIIPVYNPQEKHLRKCIESILSQTETEIEIIIIDNASVGNNPQVLQEYASKDKRINLIKFEKNAGYSGACNKGLSIAKGEFIQFVDSDDWLEYNAVEKLYNFMKLHIECDFCFFQANVYDDKLCSVTDDTTYYFNPLLYKFENEEFKFADAKDIIFFLPSQAWNKFYRKNFFERSGNKFDEELGTVLVDAFFSFNNYINSKKMVLCQEVLYNYRVNLEGSVVASLKSKSREYTNKPILFCQKLEKIQQNLGISGDASAPFVKTSLEALHWFYELFNSKNKKLFYADLQKYFRDTDESIYTSENLKLSGLQDWYKKIKTLPYFMYQITNFVYSKVDKEDYFRIKIFSITMYKRVVEKNYTKYKLLGIFSYVVKKNGELL